MIRPNNNNYIIISNKVYHNSSPQYYLFVLIILLHVGWICQNIQAFSIPPSLSSCFNNNKALKRSTALRQQQQQQRLGTKLYSLPLNFYHDAIPIGRNVTDFCSALCIVPPISAWDMLQRARHLAQDPTYHQWPPAIRLFHPFLGVSAFDVAQIIEDLHIQPFEITLEEWTIVPYIEAMQVELEYAKDAPAEARIVKKIDEEFIAFQQLIAKEEKIGKEKKRIRDEMNRKRREKRQLEEKGYIGPEPEPVPKKEKRKYRSKKVKEISYQIPQQTHEYDGPCVICLGPDQKSRTKIIELRQALQELLDLPSYSSPSSIYSWNYTHYGNNANNSQKQRDNNGNALDQYNFQPIIAISSFPTVTAAKEVARKLKGLWDPLTFSVTELHITSCFDTESNDYNPVEIATKLLHPQKLEWGCNAIIKFMGEEVKQDEEENEELLGQIMEEGHPGGLVKTDYDFYILEDDSDDDTSDLEKYLDDDENHNPGMVFVMGRIHFLSGDERDYQGMPASSQIDGKDKNWGLNSGGNAASRRRPITHRTVEKMWNDGDYGRREEDFSPFNRKQRSKRKRQRLKYTGNNHDLPQ